MTSPESLGDLTPVAHHRTSRRKDARPSELLAAALERDGVVTSERDGNLRISAHAYNTSEDIDAVLAALARHRHHVR